jgi:type I restriction enzyme M protein
VLFAASAKALAHRLDIFWLKDESLEDSANLPDPDIIAAEIAEDLEAALDQFSQIASDLKG